MLPKTLPAAICAQYVRCGKPTCRCSQGQLHGPYFYCFWREDGRLKKAYVRKADVDSVREICHADRDIRQVLRSNYDLWRSLQFELREVESHVRTNQA